VQGEPAAYVLDFTGNGTRAEWIASFLANRWAEIPVDVWVMNYPGYGGSTGPAQLAKIPRAALAAYDDIRKRAGTKPIFVTGNSLGTSAALYVATQRPVAGMMLQNPPPLQKMIMGRFGWWNLWLLAGPVTLGVPGELNSMTNAPKVTVPAVFLLADSDRVVPPGYAKCVADAYAGPKVVFPLVGADHNDRVPEGVEQKLRGELKKMWDAANK
jgi:pimeloyl-ACP methyl ester carboxylesterase